MLKTIFLLWQIFLSLLLMTFILLQAKGQGLGSAFGGGGEFYRSKRGVEKILFYATIITVILFFLSAILGLLTT